MLQESAHPAGFRDAPVAHPALSGWGSAATAIHAIQSMAVPMTLRLHVEDAGTVDVDFPNHAFAWDVALGDFPVHPASVALETLPVAAGEPPVIDLPGRTLDPLLWLIRRNAFDGRPATWLDPTHRFRLSRWPNLAELGVPLDQVRVMAMLGNTFAGAAEISGAARVDIDEVWNMVNAFSVMGILRRAAGPVEAVAARPVAPSQPVAVRSGLFGRLLDRLRH